ncbi:hypothetical protein Tsubulata_006983 [Turnera subulata]|uniref:Uncharacterized protein n=1 Tax=Turnera subulata TaxID=218843 RepID=A0A9Q0F0D1_9ROSI|nr:hypothetical protein Tsubulata_006983 [Turnera subulata]
MDAQVHSTLPKQGSNGSCILLRAQLWVEPSVLVDSAMSLNVVVPFGLDHWTWKYSFPHKTRLMEVYLLACPVKCFELNHGNTIYFLSFYGGNLGATKS